MIDEINMDQEKEEMISGIITTIATRQRRFRQIIYMYAINLTVLQPIILSGIILSIFTNRFFSPLNMINCAIFLFVFLVTMNFFRNLFNHKNGFYPKTFFWDFLIFKYLLPYVFAIIIFFLFRKKDTNELALAMSLFIVNTILVFFNVYFITVRERVLKCRPIMKYLGFCEKYGYTSNYLNAMATVIKYLDSKRIEAVEKNLKVILDV